MRRDAFSPVIRFYGTRGRLRSARRHRDWLVQCWQEMGASRSLLRVAYYFVSQETIAQLHTAFLSDPSPTDIMTFDYGDEAEIFIAPAVVRLHAREHAVSYAEELRRVMVHGLLHLAGFRDGTPEEIAAMRKAEDFCLSRWKAEVSHETFGEGL